MAWKSLAGLAAVLLAAPAWATTLTANGAAQGISPLAARPGDLGILLTQVDYPVTFLGSPGTLGARFDGQLRIDVWRNTAAELAFEYRIAGVGQGVGVQKTPLFFDTGTYAEPAYEVDQYGQADLAVRGQLGGDAFHFLAEAQGPLVNGVTQMSTPTILIRTHSRAFDELGFTDLANPIGFQGTHHLVTLEPTGGFGTVVPEPGSLGLLALSLTALAMTKRRVEPQDNL